MEQWNNGTMEQWNDGITDFHIETKLKLSWITISFVVALSPFLLVPLSAATKTESSHISPCSEPCALCPALQEVFGQNFDSDSDENESTQHFHAFAESGTGLLAKEDAQHRHDKCNAADNEDGKKDGEP
jgi:hypothetical protein